MRRSILLIAFLSLLPLQAKEPAPSQKAEIQKLIEQLGSRLPASREAASEALRQCRSTEVLPLLRAAKNHSDVEIRRRVARLLKIHEVQYASEQYLQPQVIELDYRNTELSKILKDFAHKTNLPVQLRASDQKRLGKRKVTIRTGQVSQWEALHLLLKQAGLRENLQPEKKPKRQEQQMIETQGRKIVWLNRGPYGRGTSTVPDKIELIEGKGPMAPTYHAGAIRAQALPPGNGSGGSDKSIRLLSLNVQAERTVKVQKLLGIEVKSGVDSNGKSLRQIGSFKELNPIPNYGNQEVILIWDGSFSNAPQGKKIGQKATLTLQGATTSTIRELQGTITALIETPHPEPVIHLKDVLLAKGKKTRSSSGAILEMLETQASKNGTLTLKFKLVAPKEGTGPNMQFPGVVGGGKIRLIQVNRGGLIHQAQQSVNNASLSQQGLQLLDRNGKTVSVQSGTMKTDPNGRQEFHLTLRVPLEKQRGIQLIYRARRNVVVQVPFVLKDVPVK